MTYVDITEEPQRIISFCTGIRGLERGLERINRKITTECYVEVEAFIIQNLVAQMQAGKLAPKPIWVNARTFPAHIFRNRIDGIIGGYPCQGESVAGLRELENYPGYLWPALRSAIKSIKPVWCFFENVDDHLSGTFRYVLNDLREMGYRVEVGIYTAEEIGAPHERQRVFIFAVENTACLRVRGWNSTGINGRFEVQTPGSSNLADTIDNSGRLSDSERWKPENEIAGSGETMVDTSGIGSEQEHEIPARRNGTEFTGEGRTLANSNGIGESEGITDNESTITDANGENGGNKLADSNGNDSGSRSGNSRSQGKKAEGKKHRKKRNETIGERGGAIAGNSGEDVANGPGVGCEGLERIDSGEIGETQGEQTWRWTHGNDSKVGTEESAIELQLRSHMDQHRGQISNGEMPGLQYDQKWNGNIFREHPARPGEQQYDWEEPRTITKSQFKSRLGSPTDGYNYREDFLRALGNSVHEDVTVLAFTDLLIKHIKNANV